MTQEEEKDQSEYVCPEDCSAYNYTGYCNHQPGAMWIGTDGHTYTRTKDGGVGHLDCSHDECKNR